jgi:hypothetical protein
MKNNQVLIYKTKAIKSLEKAIKSLEKAIGSLQDELRRDELRRVDLRGEAASGQTRSRGRPGRCAGPGRGRGCPGRCRGHGVADLPAAGPGAAGPGAASPGGGCPWRPWREAVAVARGGGRGARRLALEALCRWSGPELAAMARGGGWPWRETAAGRGSKRRAASGGGSRRREAAAELGIPAWCSGEMKVGETGFGANEGCGAETPAGVGAQGRIQPSPALPSCEARIELLNRAGLRGIIRVNWAVPTSAGPVYQTAKLSKISIGQRIAELGRPTKHTLSFL